MTVSADTFARGFMPRWYEAARDPAGGVYERLGLDGLPVDAAEPKTTLVQARTVFTLAHLALATGDRRLLDAAREVYGFLDAALRDEEGGYRLSTRSSLCRSYDQSFVLLALVTLARADAAAVPAGRIEALVRFIDQRLTDPADGSLYDDTAMAAAGPKAGELRAQNPHMHMMEAYLQAFEMTGKAAWLQRAKALLDLARRHFIDPATGAVREFVGPDLAPLSGVDGERREPGHQYEWAWLLHRCADLGGDEDARRGADAMLDFVQRHGLRGEGVMAGAPYDALDAAGGVAEDTHLLWPLTEAGKLHATLFIRTGDAAHRARALAIADIIFSRFFRPGEGLAPVFVNRLDGAGKALWPEALSRLLYHVALFVTEGARAGFWHHAGPGSSDTTIHYNPEEETP
ncbi:AGE family epimerase/isomerase [Aurantimonas sp. HBX-1]|uniref:AGE family epimerase/isomerase n=1 Tax=Aurantimonas sp. HBX-1 TaxID=2906072 RepID=UPI001F32D250|nr:AGE family epimerase/isomerase [Aurantimonas sp. HBX-1]UIJ73695.1 AGE family epimerase/isomerase [Aurantimonas sp. HBX-1]